MAGIRREDDKVNIHDAFDIAPTHPVLRMTGLFVRLIPAAPADRGMGRPLTSIDQGGECNEQRGKDPSSDSGIEEPTG